MARPDPVDLAAAQQIAGIECAASGIAAARVLGPERGEAVVAVRHRIAYRIWVECPSFHLKDVARAVGRTDHSTAIHAILSGAKADGLTVARVSDLREPRGDNLDWTKLAYAAAAWRSENRSTLREAGSFAGIGGQEWRKIERARPVSPGTLLRVCRAIGFQPFALLPGGGRSPQHSDASDAVAPAELKGVASKGKQSSTTVPRVTEATHAAG